MTFNRTSLLPSFRSRITIAQSTALQKPHIDCPQPPVVTDSNRLKSRQDERSKQGRARKSEHVIRDALIDLVPFKRALPRTSPAYRAPSPWTEASTDIVGTVIKERGQRIDEVAIAEAISYIELAREIRNGKSTTTSRLQKLFPEIKTEKQATSAAIDAYLRALNQDHTNDEIKDSWARAGMGYQHRKDHLALSGIVSLLSVAQALCPEPCTKAVIASARCCMGAASLYQGWKVGAERVYYKLTDELVSLGLPDGTPSLKDAPYALSAAWNLPSHSTLKDVRAQLQSAIARVEQLGTRDSAATQRHAYQTLKLIHDSYEVQRKAIDEYKATSYASQIEWAAYRQRITTLGGSAALLAGTAIGIGLAAGPIGAATGLALGIGASIPLWAASHLIYHFKGWKAPDNRDKIERALLTAIKSPDLLDKGRTSSTDIAASYARYRNERTQAASYGTSPDAVDDVFRQSLRPLLNMNVIGNAWRRPVGVRLNLGKRLLAGKFAITVHESQRLQEKIRAAPGGPLVREQIAALAEKKRSLKSCWSDLANFELFMEAVASMNDASPPHDQRKSVAVAALRRIRNGHFRDLMRGDLERQMTVGEKAKHLTKGELLKYQMTYFAGSMVGDIASIGLTLPGAIHACDQAAAPSIDASMAQAKSPDLLKIGTFASVVAAVNAAEVSAGRAHFGQDKETIYKKMVNPDLRHRVRLMPASGLTNDDIKRGYRWHDVPDAAIDELIAIGTVPQTVGLFGDREPRLPTPPLLADLTATEPYWQAQKASLPWTTRIKSAGSVAWVGIKYLGVSLTGLAHRLTASGINMTSTRATRRELDGLSDDARRLLSSQRLPGIAPRLPNLDFRDLPDLQKEIDKVISTYTANR